MGPSPSDGCVKIWVGSIAFKQETFQLLINIFSTKLLASGGGEFKKFPDIPFSVTFELCTVINLLKFSVIFS
jgi:hypothetical protein